MRIIKHLNKLSEVYPNKGESKEDFISRFMSVTKDEYPDIKQRYAVANSYWDRKKLKESNMINFEIPKYLYHATYKPFLRSIFNKGLGNTSRKMWSDSKGKGVVYLSQQPEVAYSYAEESEWLDEIEDYEKYLDNIVVLKINTDKLNKSSFYIDQNVISDDLENKDLTIEYHAVISKEAIEDIVDEQGRSIKNKNFITESTRNQLISKSKSADKYADGKTSRWDKKSICKIANTVKDYNKLDMDTFWKKDILNFGIKVEGETGNYIVDIEFNNILPKIQRNIERDKNKLEISCIYDALFSALNSSDVRVNCSCPDYRYRLKFYNSKNGDQAGDKETRASNITNPNDTKGPACKHILAALNNVEWLRKIASVINNYINYCKDNMQYNYSKYIFPKLYGIPYEKAVQMTLNDYDDKGNVKDKLESDEALLNLSNALGKVRGQFKKGSNVNTASKKTA